MANATDMLDALAEPTRRTLVERLAERPCSVTELARELPITRSAVSQHLQLLKSVGLVIDEPRGRSRVYRVDPDALALIRTYFDTFWKRSMSAFQQAAEQASPDPARHSQENQ